MNRSETVERIEELLNDHEECGSCQTCIEVDNLRNKLLYNPKIQTVLDKGKDMTKSDIAFLIGKDVNIKDIRKALRMYAIEFHEMMINWGFSKRRVDNDMAKLKEFTTDEYNGLKAQGLNDSRIAERKGVTPATISTWKKDNGISSGKVFGKKKADTETKTLKPSIPLKSQNNHLKTNYRTL